MLFLSVSSYSGCMEDKPSPTGREIFSSKEEKRLQLLAGLHRRPSSPQELDQVLSQAQLQQQLGQTKSQVQFRQQQLQLQQQELDQEQLQKQHLMRLYGEQLGKVDSQAQLIERQQEQLGKADSQLIKLKCQEQSQIRLTKLKQERLGEVEPQLIELRSQVKLKQSQLSQAESQVQSQQQQLQFKQEQLDQIKPEMELLDKKHEILEKKYTKVESAYTKVESAYTKEVDEYKKQLKGQNNIVACLPYAFGAAIAGGINPLFSRIGKEHFGHLDTETIQEDVRKLQFLSLCAAVCGGKVHKYCNVPMPIIQEHDSLLGVIIHGVFNVSAQVINATLLEYVQYVRGGRVDRSKKNDKHVAKTTRKLPQLIETSGRLFIGWSFWCAEKHFMNRFFSQ